MLPIGITALVLKFIFDLLTPILQPVTDLLPGPDIHGTGLIALLVLIYLVGLVAAFVIGRRLIDLAHRAMEVIPFVKGIYSTTRTAVQLLGGSLEANERDKYTGVVLLEFPRAGIHSIGLVTSPDGQSRRWRISVGVYTYYAHSVIRFPRYCSRFRGHHHGYIGRGRHDGGGFGRDTHAACFRADGD